MKPTNDWDFFRQQAQNLTVTPRPEVWDNLQKQLQQHKGALIRRIWITRGAAASLLLLLGYFAFQQGKTHTGVMLEDITTEQLLAESYMEKAAWSAAHLRRDANIPEGRGNKRLMPKNP